MRSERRRVLRALGALGTASLVAGCMGGGTNTETEGEPNATPMGTATPARSEYPGYNWDQLEGVEPTATDTIAMSGFQFDPLVTAVEPGTEVTVPNEDSAAHTFTAPRLGIDASVAGGERTSFTPEETGTFDFVCALHPPDMLGRLVVTEDP